MSSPFRVGFLLFPDITQLDLTGPYEVLRQMPGAEAASSLEDARARARRGRPVDCAHRHLRRQSPVRHDLRTGWLWHEPPSHGPGDARISAAPGERRPLRDLRLHGALVLGAAGLLTGKRAATHWMSRELLHHFGAIPSDERVVVDGNVITGGGVTAGIDFALKVVAEVAGEDVARGIQLSIEYDPDPPFDSGSPRVAHPDLVAKAKKDAEVRQAERHAQVKKAARALGK